MKEIMLYQDFKDTLIETLKERLPEGSILQEEVTQKENQMPLTGIFIMEKQAECGAAATLYVEELYDAYLINQDFAAITDQAAEMLQRELPDVYLEAVKPESIKEHTDRIFCELIGVKQNQKLLTAVPHRIVCQDMAVIYRYSVENSERGMLTTLLRQPIDLGMSSDELYEKAIANTQRMYPLEVVNTPIFSMVTNKNSIYGATVILYPNVLEQLSEEQGTNLYLLPSSIHEFLILPDNGEFTEKELRTMVRTVNKETVEPEDILTNSVYYYDNKSKEIMKCKDPIKRDKVR